jgi:hypothetical protein
MTKSTQAKIAVASGLFFLVALLVIAFACPNPTDFQYTVFRIILALAAAAFATVIPGILEIVLPNWVRAGGALSVFVIVYFYSPAQLAVRAAKEIHYEPPQSVSQQQLADARDAYRWAVARWEAGAATLPDVIGADRDLVNVELAVSRTPRDRETAYENADKRAADLLESVEKRIEDGTVPHSLLFQARQHRTQAEIDLAKERSTHSN